MTRKRALMAIILSGAAACVALVGVGYSQDTPAAGKWLLYPVQDEASVERKIANYLKEKDDIDATFKFARGDTTDLFAMYSLAPTGVPEIKLYVDTLVSARDGKTVNERAIQLDAFYVLPKTAKTPEARRKILELNNAWMDDQWVPHRIYLDGDGDICLQSIINIPSKETPVHAELVRDLILRMTNAWKRYYPRLAATVKIPKPKPTGD